jgi:hypothetical protein
MLSDTWLLITETGKTEETIARDNIVCNIVSVQKVKEKRTGKIDQHLLSLQ